MEFSAAGYLPPLISWIVATAAVIGTAAATVYFLHRAWRIRAQRKRVEDGRDQPLEAGEGIVFGVVERPQGPHALRVEVQQEGAPFRDTVGGTRHRWSEVRRRVYANSFRLRRPGGDWVLVEPDEETLLDDVPEDIVHRSSSRRYRIGTIDEGAEVWVSGDLVPIADPEGAASYRTAATRLALRPGRGKMRVASKSPQPHLRQEMWRFLRRARIALVLLAAVLSMSGTFWVRAFSGETVDVPVVERTYSAATENDSARYEVTVRLPSGGVFSERVTASAFEAMDEGVMVPLRYVPWNRRVSNLGAGVSIHWAFLILVGACVGVFALPFIRRRPLEWPDGPAIEVVREISITPSPEPVWMESEQPVVSQRRA